MKLSARHQLISRISRPASRAGFTLVEIAICLGIVGFALVAIIAALPRGLHTQKDSQQETIVGQDASVLFEAVRSGARGSDDLTNYVFIVSNVVTAYGAGGVPGATTRYGYAFDGSTINGAPGGNFPIINGERIVGLLSTPQFTDLAGNPTNNLYSGGFSNHVVALVRAISGVASERPPQDNAILREDTFAYRVYFVNAAVPVGDTNIFGFSPRSPQRVYSQNYWQNLHELRSTYFWPLLPNGGVGNRRQTYRVSVAGQLEVTNGLYFYRPQFFTNAP